MYQLEAKLNLIKSKFNPSEGWEVIVDIDSMERAKGNQNKPGKKERAQKAEEELIQLGVSINHNTSYGRVDIYASHPDYGIYLIEVEGEASKQKEQALYSSLSQLIIQMKKESENVFYGLAFPDLPAWERQIIKIPNYIKDILQIKCYLVSEDNVREI